MPREHKHLVHKATDLETAQAVIVAVELGRMGAGAPLIQRLTGFGPRWVRRISRLSGRVRAPRLSDPIAWLEKDMDRLVHFAVLAKTYECQPANHSPARRLLEAFRAYRALAPHREPLLDINRAAQILDLYHLGLAREARCPDCRARHQIVAADPRCPVCRSIAREIRKGRLPPRCCGIWG